MKSKSHLFFAALLITFMVFVACSGSSNNDDPDPTNASTGGDRVANSSGSATATPLPDTPSGRLASESLTAPLLTEEAGLLSRFSGQIPVASADSDDPADISLALIEDNAEAFGLSEDVSVANPVEYESTNRSVVSFEKTVNDIPIFGSAVRTHVSSSGDVVYIANSPSVSVVVPSDPEISLETASEKALESLADSISGEIAESNLVIFNPGLLDGTESESFLAYQIDLFTDDPAYLITFIDAISGEVLFQYDDFQGALDAEIYTSKMEKTVRALKPPLGQAELLMTEDGRVAGAPAHAEAQLALDYMKKIYDYYEDNFDWESFDGNDSQINAYVDFSTKKNNAFWSRKYKLMAFHEGLVKLDVFAHEFTHAVTASRSGLVYLNQSGALNEAFSDIFSEFIEGNGKWLVGEELSEPESAISGPLRNMINPPAKGDPWNYVDRYVGAADKGGVHTNSGIINHAAYLLVNGTHDPSGAKRTAFNYTATGKNGRDYPVEIRGGIGQGKAQQLLFDSQAYMIPTENFRQARSSIILTCEVMVFFGQHGFTDRDCGKVINAFAAVGIGAGDRDLDTIIDRIDNCEMDFNPLQEDEDGDGIGDLCEIPAETVLAEPTETPDPTAVTAPTRPMLEVSSITSFENESDQLFVMGEVINSGTVHASQIKIGLSVKRVGVERIEPVSSAVTDPEALPIGAVYPFWFRVNEASSVEEFDVTAIAFRTIDEVASEGIELIDDLIELRPYSPTLVNDNQQFLVTWFRKNTLKEELGFVPGALTFYDESGAVVGVVGIRGPRELAPGATARLLGAVTSDMLPDFPASYRITAAGKLPGRNAGALYITKENDRFETPEISVSIQTNTGYVGFGSGWLYGEVTNTGNLPTRGPDITITMSDGRTASGPGLIGFDGILDPGETVPYQALYGAQSDDIKTVDSVEWSTRFYRELPEPPRPEVTVSGLSFKEIVDNVRIGNRRVDAVVNEITGTVTNNTEHTLSVSLSGVLRSGGVIVDIMSHNGVNNTTDLRHFEPGERFNFKFQSRPNNLGTDAEVRQSVQCKTCP